MAARGHLPLHRTGPTAGLDTTLVQSVHEDGYSETVKDKE
jgi:hypothetical protein